MLGPREGKAAQQENRRRENKDVAGGSMFKFCGVTARDAPGGMMGAGACKEAGIRIGQCGVPQCSWCWKGVLVQPGMSASPGLLSTGAWDVCWLMTYSVGDFWYPITASQEFSYLWLQSPTVTLLTDLSENSTSRLNSALAGAAEIL